MLRISKSAPPLIKLVDYYFVVASRLIPEWRRLNPNTFWLPQGLQEEVYHKPEHLGGGDILRYSCDISFAGRDRGPRRPFLDAVDQRTVKFNKWGCDGNPKVYNEEHNKMASLSKINLCLSGWPENEKYTSVRTYKIMGAGGFAMELQRTKLDEVFPLELPGVMGTCISPVDMVNRIGFWLSHDEKRRAVAERGYHWVHANATYTHRIKQALEIMGL